MPDPKVQDTKAKAKTHRAEIATIDFGAFKIQGLLLQDASFAVAVSQIAELFSFLNKNLSRELKALLGAGFPFLKVTSKLNSKAVNCISLSQFATVIIKLAHEGNPIAQELNLLTVEFTMQARFSKAFGKKFDVEDQDKWLKARATAKRARRALTDLVKDYREAHPELSENTLRWMYSNCSDTLNIALTGQKSRHWKDSLGLKEKDLLRDYWSDSVLKKIESIEDFIGVLIDEDGMGPLTATKAAIVTLRIKVIPEDKLFKPKPTA